MSSSRTPHRASPEAAPLPQKEAAILQVMLELVAEHGFHGTSTDMIARRAGVGAGTIYRYFETKDALILRVHDWVKTEAASLVFAEDDVQLPLRERLRRIWRNTARALLDNRDAAFFLDQFNNSPYIHQVSPQTLARFAQPVADLFKAAVRAQVVRDMSLPVFDALFINPIRHLVRLHHLGQLKLDDALLEQALEGCWNAIRQ